MVASGSEEEWGVESAATNKERYCHPDTYNRQWGCQFCVDSSRCFSTIGKWRHLDFWLVVLEIVT